MSHVKLHPAEIARVREAVAYGMLNLGFAIEGDAKRDCPVRGGHRSFMTAGNTKAGTPRMGGTLRRSIHTEAYLDGRKIGGTGTDENGNGTPPYAPGSGIAVFVGTNCNYGLYVEKGTVKMQPPRPFVGPAVAKNREAAPGLIAAGFRKRYGQ